MTTEDYSGYIEETKSEDSLVMLANLANEQAVAETRVKRIEADLEKARDELREISEKKIPELMDELGLEDFRTRTGLRIKIKETIHASIAKNNQQAAFEWLRANGHAGLVKRLVSVSFGKGEDKVAEEVFKMLMENYEGVEDKASVHPSTLKAFVNERLAEGEDIPLDLFGVHRRRTSVIG